MLASSRAVRRIRHLGHDAFEFHFSRTRIEVRPVHEVLAVQDALRPALRQHGLQHALAFTYRRRSRITTITVKDATLTTGSARASERDEGRREEATRDIDNSGWGRTWLTDPDRQCRERALTRQDLRLPHHRSTWTRNPRVVTVPLHRVDPNLAPGDIRGLVSCGAAAKAAASTIPIVFTTGGAGQKAA